jgi:hypothetical protein
MDRALWLLVWLTFRGWARRLRRTAQTPKGMVLTVLGALIFVPMMFNVVLVATAFPEEEIAAKTAEIRHFGPAALLAYLVLALLLSSAEHGLTFTPAEIGFLFPAPFSRRQLVAYKIVTALLRSLLGTLFMTAVFHVYAPHFLAAFVGLLLAIVFFHLFAVAGALLANLLGALLYSRMRKLALGGLLVLILAVLLPHAGQLGSEGLRGLVDRLNDAPFFRVVLAPLRWFVEAFTAERLWPDLARWAVLGLAADAALLGVVLALDAQYLETAAAASERLYARLERLRATGSTIGVLSGRRPGRSLPMFPAWGGAGAIAWRQALTAWRGARGLLLFLLILCVPVAMPFLAPAEDRPDVVKFLTYGTAGMAMTTVLVLPALMTYDFRGDLDRMDFLKTLPLPPIGLVIGQLIVPVACTTVLQCLLLSILALFAADDAGLVLAGAVFLPPANFLLYAVENLVFLVYPIRMVAATPGDLQHLGRHTLVFVAKGLLLGVGALVTALTAGLTYVISGESWLATGLVVWLLLAAMGAALVPVLAFFFQRFDVARDTPP